MKSEMIQRSRRKRLLDEKWPEILEKVKSGQSLHRLALEYGLNRRTLRGRLQKAGVLQRGQTQDKSERSIPCRDDPPYEFRCCHCHKWVYVDPSTGDKRFKFCCRNCERAYWKHQDRNAGIRAAIWKVLPNGSLMEVTKGH